MKVNSVLELIGNTPIIEIGKEITGLQNVNLFVKCELFNPFGSLKDRPAYNMLKDNIKEIKENGKTVIESSSGNTAKALSIICNMNGIPFKTITNRIKIPETRDVLKIVGTEIEELPGISECPDPTDPNDPVSYIENIVSKDPEKFFHCNQYTNLKNPEAHYLGTGKEIFDDIGNVDYFFGALGTTGSTRGTIEFLLTKNSDLKKVGIIAEKGDNIPGIRNKDEMYEVGIFDKSLYDEVVSVNSMEAIDGMLTLNRKLGILAGPTSGCAFFGALRYLKELDGKLNKKINAVSIACDRVEWYVSYIRKRRPDIFDSDIKVDSVRNIKEEDLKFAKVVECEDITNFISEEKPIIIDLRGNLAYKNGHINDAMNITDTYFDDIVDNGIPFSKESKILLVCAVGDKSYKFSAYLNKKGLNVYSLKGGMTEYREQGLPLVRMMTRAII